MYKNKTMGSEFQVLDVLRWIGISKCQSVLDFGCGYGAYTIPVAEIVGECGIVYALDKDKEALDSLMQKAESQGLNNIDRMETSGGLEIGLTDESLDVVLLFDVFHSFFFPRAVDREMLLSEIRRVMKSSGFLSISLWPNLVVPAVDNEIADSGFHFDKEISGMTVSNKDLDTCKYLNYKKILTNIT